MELLEQCQLWCEQGDYQTIVETLEAIPAGQRTPEMDSELGRAYNGLAGEGQRELYQTALELLKPHEEYFEKDHCWTFRIASSY